MVRTFFSCVREDGAVRRYLCMVFLFCFSLFSMRGREQLDMDSGQGDTCHSEDSEVRRKLS
jgi:hypothetical protein